MFLKDSTFLPMNKTSNILSDIASAARDNLEMGLNGAEYFNRIGLLRPALLVGGLGVPIVTGLIAKNHLDREMHELKKPERGETAAILRHYGLENMPVVKYKDLQNAGYIDSGAFQKSLFGEGMHSTDPVLKAYVKENPGSVERFRNHGAVIYDPKFNRPAIIAHEAGHATIGNEHPLSLNRINQGPLRTLSGFASLLSSPAGLIGGAATGHPLTGGLMGGLVGAGLAAPTLINEIQATGRAHDYIDKFMDPEEAKKSRRTLDTAFRTYLLSSLAAPLALGALGGYLSDATRKSRASL